MLIYFILVHRLNYVTRYIAVVAVACTRTNDYCQTFICERNTTCFSRWLESNRNW